MESLRFFRSRIFFITIAAQLIAPLMIHFGNWANVIQYLSGFGMAYAVWEYFHVHKPQIRQMEEQMFHLHKKQDLLHEKQDLLHKKQDRMSLGQHRMNELQDRMDEKQDELNQKQNLIHEKQDKIDEEMNVH